MLVPCMILLNVLRLPLVLAATSTSLSRLPALFNYLPIDMNVFFAGPGIDNSYRQFEL
jgi:hypothetical protein